MRIAHSALKSMTVLLGRYDLLVMLRYRSHSQPGPTSIKPLSVQFVGRGREDCR
jgi:hypothetical protein